MSAKIDLTGKVFGRLTVILKIQSDHHTVMLSGLVIVSVGKMFL